MGSKFQLIPVLDVLEGRAVHAIGGDRARYRPLRSILHAGHGPRELARAFRDVLGFATVYLADLDAITQRRGEPSLYRDLVDLGLDIWVDAGIEDRDDLAPLLDVERLQVIAGLESLRGPDALADVLDRAGPDRLIVSLDLRDGRPITAAPDAWPERAALALAHRILDMGVRRLILLDLAHVGRGAGPGTDHLLGPLLQAHPRVEFTVGGGISGVDEAAAWRDRGAAAVLVGSALHDGRIDRNALIAMDGGL
ncbi:HisA/HisF-related TIM barrel protein [Paludisphaera mucosa]|uniref:HisA/HisF-related TIM barrel protein n=1 Tax=Paludisphaera mucosa TaxID=3030827 RepID=A0ABT6FFW6_9BACT|nr:HisA/HisF-related TIM barrel protein [Paludisphaera mucosa]MDG3006394.1 HisA/HisF-related TIM barrel protein [Paludisphaera mucosa]